MHNIFFNYIDNKVIQKLYIITDPCVLANEAVWPAILLWQLNLVFSSPDQAEVHHLYISAAPQLAEEESFYKTKIEKLVY